MKLITNEKKLIKNGRNFVSYVETYIKSTEAEKLTWFNDSVEGKGVAVWSDVDKYEVSTGENISFLRARINSLIALRDSISKSVDAENDYINDCNKILTKVSKCLHNDRMRLSRLTGEKVNREGAPQTVVYMPNVGVEGVFTSDSGYDCSASTLLVDYFKEVTDFGLEDAFKRTDGLIPVKPKENPLSVEFVPLDDAYVNKNTRNEGSLIKTYFNGIKRDTPEGKKAYLLDKRGQFLNEVFRYVRSEADSAVCFRSYPSSLSEEDICITSGTLTQDELKKLVDLCVDLELSFSINRPFKNLVTRKKPYNYHSYGIAVNRDLLNGMNDEDREKITKLLTFFN